jgi:hypothetical protein
MNRHELTGFLFQVETYEKVAPGKIKPAGSGIALPVHHFSYRKAKQWKRLTGF